MSEDEILEVIASQLDISITTSYEGESVYARVSLILGGEEIASDSVLLET